MGGYHELSDSLFSFACAVSVPYLALVVLPPSVPLLYTCIIHTAILSKSYVPLELFSFHPILA